MKLLWTKELQMNTVHVSDVVRAAWHVATLKDDHQQSHPIYNLADKANTSQCTSEYSGRFPSLNLMSGPVMSIQIIKESMIQGVCRGLLNIEY